MNPTGERRTRSVSMGDVARLAEVSGQTVSRVANGSTQVASPTRKRVLQAMDALGYRPNVAARALRNGSFRSIGVVVFTLATLGNTRTIAGVCAGAAERGYAIELIEVGASRTTDPTHVSSALSRLGQDAVDGVIAIIESHVLDEAALRFPEGVPTVIVDSAALPQLPSVDADQHLGARLAVNHLLDLGHPTVHHIAGPASSNAAEQRIAAWQAALAERGCPVPPPVRADWTAQDGYLAGRELAARPEVSAIFAASDQMALGAMRAYHELGIPVGRDVSIVGFDDMAEAANFWPPLTTVHQDFEAVGELAVSLIVESIEQGGVAAGVRKVPTALVARGSTGPYRVRGSG